MLSMTLSTDERITNAHRAKLAYVYVSNRSQLRPPFRAQSRPLLGLRAVDVDLVVMIWPRLGRPSVSG